MKVKEVGGVPKQLKPQFSQETRQTTAIDGTSDNMVNTQGGLPAGHFESDDEVLPPNHSAPQGNEELFDDAGEDNVQDDFDDHDDDDDQIDDDIIDSTALIDK